MSQEEFKELQEFKEDCRPAATTRTLEPAGKDRVCAPRFGSRVRFSIGNWALKDTQSWNGFAARRTRAFLLELLELLELLYILALLCQQLRRRHRTLERTHFPLGF